MFAYMSRKIFVYFFLFITLFIAVNALPRPNTDDLIKQDSQQEQVLDNGETKSVLARLRDCLKGGQFDISKGCRPQRVDKHIISIESPSLNKVNAPQPDKSGRSGKHQYISNEAFDCLTSDLLLM
ncbi:hypothetical protein BC943DRAFT_325598 [Umbelopsis sp. AD052]|nr:hypothetical protein BC943DRAFT_325598 [Umbelopsis sp. AD052]